MITSSSSTTSARPRRAGLPAAARPPGRHASTARLRGRGAAGCCEAEDGRRGVPRHPDARPGRPGAGPGAVARSRKPPAVVFVTAYDERAVDAFDLDGRRLRAQAGARPSGWPRRPPGRRAASRTARAAAETTIPVELGGVTRFVSAAPTSPTSRRRATTPGCTPPTAPTWSASRWPRWRSSWADAGFVRIHRSLPGRADARRRAAPSTPAACTVVGRPELPVSRRHTRELRELLAATRTGRQA